MTYAKPNFRHPDLPLNEIGYARKEYEGAISTLCAGCGHDSISGAIIQMRIWIQKKLLRIPWLHALEKMVLKEQRV